MEITKQNYLKELEIRHGKDLQDKISSSTVAICGLGGLGSNIAIALARAGIGKLILIDFDKVDISNLHRQQYKTSQIGMCKTDALKINLKEIAPFTNVETHLEKIDQNNATKILDCADIICEAFDCAKDKAMLANVVLEKMPDKYYIASSGMAGLKSANEIKTSKITDKFYLCGDQKSDVNEEGTLFSTRAMVCAAHQAHMVLRIIAGKKEI